MPARRAGLEIQAETIRGDGLSPDQRMARDPLPATGPERFGGKTLVRVNLLSPDGPPGPRPSSPLKYASDFVLPWSRRKP